MPLDPDTQHDFDEIADYIATQAQNQISRLKIILTQCKSPAQQRLLLHFLSLRIQGITIDHRSTMPFIVIEWYVNMGPRPATGLIPLSDCRILIEPQHPVEVKGITVTVDFLITLRVKLVAPGDSDTEIARLIVDVNDDPPHVHTARYSQFDQAGYTIMHFKTVDVIRDSGPAVDAIENYLDAIGIAKLSPYLSQRMTPSP